MRYNQQEKVYKKVYSVETYSFGEWVSQRRAAQDMTQRELAVKAACALATIKKIESDERRPSRELALLLAEALHVPPDWHDRFVECARGLRPVDMLAGMKAQKIPIRANGGALFIGRETELAQIAELFAQPACRLLTLVGPGGIGKTRLAAEAAQDLAHLFEDGAAFVPLVAVTDAALIPLAIAHNLNLTFGDEAQLYAYLRDQKMLLVLDNCEQLGDGVGWFSELLSHAHGIRLLATSRERLHLAEEWAYTVPELSETQALSLFKQTAQRTSTDANVDAQEDDALEVCRLVNNLPLAIELAAGWLSMMSCAQIAEHIRRDIDFLAANVRNIPERHRSIRAVFDYSWKLLSAAEQDALMRLSVFRGGWTVDESTPVAGATLPVLRSLVEKSLVRAAGRYDLHELTHQYAAEKLRESGQDIDTHVRHAETCIALAFRLLCEITGPQAVSAFSRLDAEMDNFRAALMWSLESGKIEITMQILHNLFFPWLRRGYWLEGERWVTLAVQGANREDKWLALLLIHLSTFLALQGRFTEASVHLERAGALAHHLQDTEALLTLHEVGFQAIPQLEQAQAAYEAFVQLIDQWDHPSKASRLAGAHFLFGDRLRMVGQHNEARRLYVQSVEMFHQIGNVDMIAYPMGNLGRLALQEGRYEEAYDRFTESVSISRKTSNRVGIADWVQQLGRAALSLGDMAQAKACFDEALALYIEMGNRRAEPDPLTCLGTIALLQGDRDRAEEYLNAALAGYTRVYQQKPDIWQQWSKIVLPDLVNCLFGLALIAEPERAVTLFSTVDKLRSLVPALPQLQLESDAERMLANLRERISDADFERLWDEGQTLSLDEMLALAAPL